MVKLMPTNVHRSHEISWKSAQCWLLRVTSQVSTGYLVTSQPPPPPRVSHLPSPSHAGPPQRATGMKKRRDGRGRRDGASWTMATICIIGICITLDLTCVSFATSAGILNCQQNQRECHMLRFRDTALEFRRIYSNRFPTLRGCVLTRMQSHLQSELMQL